MNFHFLFSSDGSWLVAIDWYSYSNCCFSGNLAVRCSTDHESDPRATEQEIIRSWKWRFYNDKLSRLLFLLRFLIMLFVPREEKLKMFICILWCGVSFNAPHDCPTDLERCNSVHGSGKWCQWVVKWETSGNWNNVLKLLMHHQIRSLSSD